MEEAVTFSLMVIATKVNSKTVNDMELGSCFSMMAASEKDHGVTTDPWERYRILKRKFSYARLNNNKLREFKIIVF